MLNISKELFTAWNNASLLYCHWKSNEHLLPGLDGETDLDVLLSRDDQKEGVSILRRLEFLQVQSQFGSRYPDVDDWIGFDKETGNLIHLHLHYGIITGHKGLKEYSLHWTDLALRTRILNEEYGVYTMEPNLELVTLYTRIGLKADFKTLSNCRKGRYSLSKDTQREIDWLKERVDFRKVEQLVRTFYNEEDTTVFEIIKKANIDSSDLLELQKISEANFRENSRIKHFMRLREKMFFAYKRWGQRVEELLHPVISKKVPISGHGISIAFLGQDGSGKSTVTSEIKKWLSWKLDTRRFYLGSGDEYYNPWQKKLLKRIKNKKNVFCKLLRIWLPFSYQLASAKYVRKTIERAAAYTSKGGVALFDRYPQTEYQGINDGPKIRTMLLPRVPRGLKWLAGIYVKREEAILSRAVGRSPKLIFKLLLSPEESKRRRPNDNIEIIRRKHDIVKSLIFPSSVVIEIDAEQPYGKEILLIKNEIWQQMLKL